MFCGHPCIFTCVRSGREKGMEVERKVYSTVEHGHKLGAQTGVHNPFPKSVPLDPSFPAFLSYGLTAHRKIHSLGMLYSTESEARYQNSPRSHSRHRQTNFDSRRQCCSSKNGCLSKTFVSLMYCIPTVNTHSQNCRCSLQSECAYPCRMLTPPRSHVLSGMKSGEM